MNEITLDRNPSGIIKQHTHTHTQSQSTYYTRALSTKMYISSRHVYTNRNSLKVCKCARHFHFKNSKKIPKKSFCCCCCWGGVAKFGETETQRFEFFFFVIFFFFSFVNKHQNKETIFSSFAWNVLFFRDENQTKNGQNQSRGSARDNFVIKIMRSVPTLRVCLALHLKFSSFSWKCEQILRF